MGGGPPGDRKEEERRFREDEARAILARASSRETRTDLPAPHDPTLRDLMAAAAGAGLDPGEVRRAAALEPPRKGGPVDLLLGGPDRRRITARLPGAAIPGDTWGVVRRVEEATGARGEVVESAPGRFVWRGEGVMDRYGLELRQEGGALELRATSDRAGTYFALWLAGVLVWAVLSVATPLGSLPALAKLAAFLAAPLALVRPFWSAMDRRVARRLETLALDVLRAAEEGGPDRLQPGEGSGP